MFLTPNTEKLETHGLLHNTWAGLGERGLWIIPLHIQTPNQGTQLHIAVLYFMVIWVSKYDQQSTRNPVGVERNRKQVFVQPSAVRDSNDELLNDHLRNTPIVPLLYFTAHTNSK